MHWTRMCIVYNSTCMCPFTECRFYIRPEVAKEYKFIQGQSSWTNKIHIAWQLNASRSHNDWPIEGGKRTGNEPNHASWNPYTSGQRSSHRMVVLSCCCCCCCWLAYNSCNGRQHPSVPVGTMNERHRAIRLRADVHQSKTIYTEIRQRHDAGHGNGAVFASIVGLDGRTGGRRQR